MTYALNREPEWFNAVQWVIDATHFPGHTGCAYAFDIKRQPCLSRLNSQICEQRNSRLALVLKQCAFMGQLTFLPYIRYFAHGINVVRHLPWKQSGFR
ncbi:hypothetical protein WJX77_009611 [Trebouxia sp. C0004]